MKKKPISDILRSNKTVFTFEDISMIWGDGNPKTVIAAVNYYVRTNQLHRVRRGIYAKEKNYDKLELATRIFTPSYVSFETVLVQAGIIFQFYKKITVASYQTRKIIADGQVYSYRKIKNTILTNPLGVKHQDEKSIASGERAFLDTIYIYKNYHFDNLSPLNKDKIFDILPIYNNKQMAIKVNEILSEK